MDNNNDVKEELKIKNQEMLSNKKKIDLDKSMDSLLVFFDNYSASLAIELNNQICIIKSIDSNSEQSKIMLNTINSFIKMLSDKLRELVLKRVEKIKEKLDIITNDEYDKQLRYLAIYANNQLLEFYGENIDMLITELTNDVDNKTKEKISNYIFEVIYGRLMNMLKDKFMYSIKVITNNYEENYQLIESINEKTLNKV